jgi:phosphatidylinositol alpha-1,6-mannosyltransferase
MTDAPAILALVTDAYGGRGGIAQYNRDFIAALASSGAVSLVTVLPRHAPDPVELPSERIEQLSPRPGRLAYAVAALRLALFRRVDVVFCGHLFLAPLAIVLAYLKGAKFVVQTHGIEVWPRPSRLRRAALEAADWVLCVSRHTRATVLGWAVNAPERVLVLPNTVGDAFVPGDRQALRSAWGLDDKRVLLTVARMDARQRYKGHDRVIAAMPGLVASGHDVVYTVVGEGDDRPRLQALATEHGVAERVRFMGALSPEKVVDAYRMADVFVMPSTGEGFGIAFLEAMACGTPALGFAVGGAVDALLDGELGTMAAAAAFPTTLARLLAVPRPDPQRLAAAVCSRFGRAVFAGAVTNVMSRILEAPKSAAPLPAQLCIRSGN